MVEKRKSGTEPDPDVASPPQLVVSYTKSFDRDLDRMAKRGKDLAKLRAVVDSLRNRVALEVSRRDHALTGEWVGYRDVHVEPNWILVYERTDTELRLMRTGTHADLGF